MNVKSLAIITSIIVMLGGLAYAANQVDGASISQSKSISYRPSIVVYKNSHCDCCLRWVEHLEANRFTVRVENVDNLSRVKKRVGVPLEKHSCHTAEIEGYFIEGHVPAEDIKRLIKTRPDAKGLAVPAMPIGSPGMEQGNEFEPYDVLLIDKAGNASVFSHHDK
jgi:hypothetical protein